ncbi:uncharacterized protein LOC111458305 isoform X1 [Cucurbita moschata]|uniref:Uncharacterized protein LOC111458305 isoform X1 n=1 Tax=Cucurbita moschata TaxID=3662 RepID=A0A6J1GWW6_CUCMO|nr:uncharacterized protein LOC111458305 isoform X1 [Cucurbita moschata]
MDEALKRWTLASASANQNSNALEHSVGGAARSDRSVPAELSEDSITQVAHGLRDWRGIYYKVWWFRESFGLIVQALVHQPRSQVINPFFCITYFAISLYFRYGL